jgi:hypothetical protein
MDAEQLLEMHGYDTSKMTEEELENADDKLEREIEDYMESFLMDSGGRDFAFELAHEYELKKRVKRVKSK